MDLARLINHPERMNRETAYDLRSLLALHPYYQTARILLLQNLYLLHDPTFDEELRRAAVYVTDRSVLFQLVEAAHYQLKRQETGSRERELSSLHDKVTNDAPPIPNTQTPEHPNAQTAGGSRTDTLINQFLESIPTESVEEHHPKRRPTPADATIDYVAYLLDVEEEAEEKGERELETGDERLEPDTPNAQTPSRTDALIDQFILNEGGSFELKEEPEFIPELNDNTETEPNEEDEGYFTETLARIYIKQGRYSKALEIIKRLNLLYPKKNRYFADQIRFLEKLIINNNNKITEK